MTPLKVHTPLPSTVSPAALEGLLAEAGLTAVSDTDWIADCSGGDKVAVLLIVVPADAVMAESLDAPVRAAASRGDRIIAIWSPGAVQGDVPASLQDYGTALVAWDPVALHAAVCGDLPEWQDTGGGQREAPKLGRNKNC